jgi:transposase-like protein
VRQAGQGLDAAVLIACGVDDDGHRDILGCSVSLSEAEVHWRAFLSALKDRGLCGVELIVSDAHEGLQAARKAVFPSVPWQRCQFHLQQNAGHYVPKMSLRAPVAAAIRAIFNAPDREEAEHLLDKFQRHYEKKIAPQLVQWAEEAIPEGFTVFALPPRHRRRLRTTNLVERLNEEIRRRTRVARLFPNEAACLRLVSAILDADPDRQRAGRPRPGPDRPGGRGWRGTDHRAGFVHHPPAARQARAAADDAGFGAHRALHG